MSEPVDFVEAVELDELKAEGRKLVNKRGQAIALFYHEGEVRAVDNRCPHMGFPLTEGTVDDGLLTCHWHHARFELSCGDTFDPWADDVPTYPVEVRDGTVWVRPETQREKPPEEHWRDRLDVGLRENLRLVAAKSVIGLDDAGVDYTVPFRRAVEFGTEYNSNGWGRGLTTLVALTNLRPSLREEDRRRAMYRGVTEVASDCAGESPWFDQPPLGSRSSKDRLKEWFRDTVEVRDADGAERCLRTAAQTLPEEDVAELLLSAATDHLYLNTGHSLDFVNKTFEALDYVGWEAAPDVIPSLVTNLTGADRAEESSQWRQPIDLAGLLFETYDDLPAMIGQGSEATWTAPDGFTDTLLADDPHAVVGALADAVREGASAEELAREVAYAAAIRVAQFSTSNEFGDWNTVHHTYTYSNAVHGMTRRTDAPEGYRAVLDAAMNVYLDRFLNMPPAGIPEGDPSADPEEALEALMETFDEEGEVNAAGGLAADYLAGGGEPAALKRALGEAMLREDVGFHTIQNVEVGFRQADLQPERRRVFLLAAARYLSAHTPTRREAEQTFRIATRLHRGERLHEAAESADAGEAAEAADD